METLIIKTPDKATADKIRKYAEQFADVQVSDDKFDKLTATILRLEGAWDDNDISAEQLRKEAWERNPA